MDVKTINSENLITILPNCLAIASAFIRIDKLYIGYSFKINLGLLNLLQVTFNSRDMM